MTAAHLVLVGLMGSGKTTVGRIVAERLGRPFLDSDDVVEARTGRTVREIWRSDGEAAFRRLEREALRDALAADKPSVIAAAGGVVLSADNRAALNDAHAVVAWLHADNATLVARATSGEHRPLLDADPAGTLAQMAAEREPLYRDVADVVVDTGERSAADVAEEIIGILDG